MFVASQNQNAYQLREHIRKLALKAGFDLAGFAPATPTPYADAFSEWLRRGFHADMCYMSREPYVRHSITRWAPEARTVLMLAINYYVPARFAPHALIIARYALGEDYHLWMKKRLIALGRSIASSLSVPIRWRTFLDTAPVLERAYAMQAGLGWIGKNTMLINHRLGSYLFLGGIVMDLDLPPDAPVRDHCGTCSRCIEACPTRAITTGRLVDARLCLAYHTIETRSPLPPEITQALGRRFFGCDVCQEVCPMNREPGASPHPNLVPTTEPCCRLRPNLLALTAQQIMTMPDRELLAICRRSALRRAGFQGLRRTAAAILTLQTS